jgi:hypothetical protein
MGGLVIRAALAHLSKYKKMFYNFVSLSSPHLGCVYDSSFMIHAGMKIMEKFNTNAVSLKQMAMRDHHIVTKTFLYNLSANKALNDF